MNYRPEIDGLRAVAILPVVLYHAGIAGFSGGFVGVDVFFVISGYLITSIIVLERRAGSFTLADFYARRIRRIFPALFVMMAASYPIAWLLLDPAAMKEFSGSVAASTVFLANEFFLGVSGYFDTAAEMKPLLHNWSLAVEEQFYLIFPATVLLSWRMGPRGQAALFAALAALSLGLAQWYIGRGEAAKAFFHLSTRFWELMAGALSAYWLLGARGARLRDSGRLRHGALAGLAMIVIAVIAYDDETEFPGVAALLPCLGAVLVIAFANRSGLAGKILGWHPVVLVGALSYSLYLWHVPLLTFTRIGTGRDDAGLLLGVCLLAFAIAWLSWRYVERPIRRMHTLPRLQLFGAAAACMAVVGGAGLIGVHTDGFRTLYLAHRLDPVTRARFERLSPPEIRPRVADDGCQFRREVLNDDFAKRFATCARTHGKAVFVLGDSHAWNIYNALRSTGRLPFLVGLTHGGCRPFRLKKKCPYEAVVPFVKANRAAISQLVFQVSGSHYILDHRNEGYSDAAFIPGTKARIAESDIEATARYLGRFPEDLDVVWLGPFAEARVNLDNPENYSPERLRFNPVSLDRFRLLDARLKKVAAGQKAAFRYVSLFDALAFDKETLVQGDCLTFSDRDHLSPCGERLFAPTILEALSRQRLAWEGAGGG